MRTVNYFISAIPALLFFASCDRGYEVRVANYYIEKFDTVFVGTEVVFEDVDKKETTDFKKIGKGFHTITFKTATGNYLYGEISIPRHGDGNRTIQIDAIKQISILEE